MHRESNIFTIAAFRFALGFSVRSVIFMKKREYITGKEMSDRLWKKLEPLLPEPARSNKGGR